MTKVHLEPCDELFALKHTSVTSCTTVLWTITLDCTRVAQHYSNLSQEFLLISWLSLDAALWFMLSRKRACFRLAAPRAGGWSLCVCGGDHQPHTLRLALQAVDAECSVSSICISVYIVWQQLSMTEERTHTHTHRWMGIFMLKACPTSFLCARLHLCCCSYKNSS